MMVFTEVAQRCSKPGAKLKLISHIFLFIFIMSNIKNIYELYVAPTQGLFEDL